MERDTRIAVPGSHLTAADSHRLLEVWCKRCQRTKQNGEKQKQTKNVRISGKQYFSHSTCPIDAFPKRPSFPVVIYVAHYKYILLCNPLFKSGALQEGKW